MKHEFVEDVPYFPESHHEASDLIYSSISKLDQEVEKRKDDEDDGLVGPRY